jgi:hypothetical protein
VKFGSLSIIDIKTGIIASPFPSAKMDEKKLIKNNFFYCLEFFFFVNKRYGKAKTFDFQLP